MFKIKFVALFPFVASLFSCFSISAQDVDSPSSLNTNITANSSSCIEAKNGIHFGAVKTYPKSVVMYPNGILRIPFSIPKDDLIHVWVRARAPTLENNKIRLGIDVVPTSDAEIWDIPVTPVLRWQRAVLRGKKGTFYRADNQMWPKRLKAGSHTLHIAGNTPDVEINAVCFNSSTDYAPKEPFKVPPVRHSTHYLNNYGAIGNGIADDTDALQNALSALKPGDALYIPPGRYRFTKTLQINTDNVSVMGSGTDSVLFAEFPKQSESKAAISVSSNLPYAVKTPLIYSAKMLARELVITANSALQTGDSVVVSSNEWGPPAPNLNTLFHRNRANIARIIETHIEGDTKKLTLDRPLLGPFLIENGAAVEKFRPITGIVFYKLAIEGTNKPIPADNADMSLINVQRCDNCFFNDLHLSHARVAAIHFLRSLDSHATRVHIFDVTDTSGGGHGYGIVINRSQGIIVRDSLFDGILRHGVPISWGTVESFIFRNKFDRSIQHENNIQSIDIHGQDDYANLVEQNKIIGGVMGIVVGGGGTTHGNDGPWNVIRNNIIVNSDDGIGVFKKTHNTIIDRNSLINIKKRAIRIESGSDAAHIWNNRIDNYGATAIILKDSKNGSIFKNTFIKGKGDAIKQYNSKNYRIDENVP